MTHVNTVETRLRHRGVNNNWADPRVQQLNLDSNRNNELDEDPLNVAHGPADGGESDVSSLMGRMGMVCRPPSPLVPILVCHRLDALLNGVEHRSLPRAAPWVLWCWADT